MSESIKDLCTIKIDVTDWVQETQEAEPEFTTTEQAYAEAQRHGWPLRKTAILYHTKQRMGQTVEQVFDPTGKQELGEGVYQRFLDRAPLRRLLRGGATEPTSEDDDSEPETVGLYHDYASKDGRVVETHSKDGVESWRNYLLTACVGHVRRALTALAAAGLDPVAELEPLVQRLEAEAVKLAE